MSARGNMLLPGTELKAGDYLVSTSGRFRADVSSLAISAYVVDWKIPGRAGRYNTRIGIFGIQTDPPGTVAARLKLPTKGKCYLVDSAGNVVWQPPNDPGFHMENAYLIMQDDGNLVQYAKHPTGDYAAWASGTHNWGRHSHAVVPNSTTIVVSAGTISLGEEPGPGNGDLINNMLIPVGCRDQHQYVTIPPKEKIIVSGSGQVILEALTYNFDDEHPPQSGSMGAGSSISVYDRTVAADGRFKATIETGFRLT